ncbi:MAG: GNAT family N-acetyltransferase [Bacteroidota bacterium]
MNAKEEYRLFATHERLNLFSQPWWLDAVCESNQWNVVLAKKENKVIASMPYLLRFKFGLKYLISPPLTQTLGPCICKLDGKYINNLAQQKNIFNNLIAELPDFDLFCQNFHYSINNWLPFYWNGFTQTTRYTYVIDSLHDLDEVWSNFKGSIRSDIRKAQKTLKIRDDSNLDKLLDLVKMTFERQGLNIPYSTSLVHRIDDACRIRESRKILLAEDAKQRTHAAIYIVWDDDSAYYLIGGGDPELRSSGAMSLLLWEAIKFSSKVTNKFDFEGSMYESIERFFRAFGAIQTPYFRIRKMSKRMQFCMSSRDIVKAIFSSE